MDKEQVALDVMNWVKETVEKGEAFIAQEAPLLAQEIVAWYFWHGVIVALSCVASMALVLFAWWFFFQRIPQWASDRMDQSFSYALASVVSIGLLLAASSTAVVQGVVPAVKATVAPRVVVLEEVSKSLRSVR